MAEESKALDALTIVDLCSGGAGSHAAQLLAASGADVIIVSLPGSTGQFSWYSAGKLSLILDYRTPSGAAVLSRVLERCDGLVEDASSARDSLPGLQAEALIARIPRLVICRVQDFTPRGGVPAAVLSQIESVHGLQVFGGFLAGLWRAAQTEHGQLLEINSSEALLSVAPSPLEINSISATGNLSPGDLGSAAYWQNASSSPANDAPLLPFDLSGTPPGMGPRPQPGEHSEYVLSNYAELTVGEIDALRAEGLV